MVDDEIYKSLFIKDNFHNTNLLLFNKAHCIHLIVLNFHHHIIQTLAPINHLRTSNYIIYQIGKILNMGHNLSISHFHNQDKPNDTKIHTSYYIHHIISSYHHHIIQTHLPQHLHIKEYIFFIEVHKSNLECCILNKFLIHK